MYYNVHNSKPIQLFYFIFFNDLLCFNFFFFIDIYIHGYICGCYFILLQLLGFFCFCYKFYLVSFYNTNASVFLLLFVGFAMRILNFNGKKSSFFLRGGGGGSHCKSAQHTFTRHSTRMAFLISRFR